MLHPHPHLRLGRVAPAVEQSHGPVPAPDGAHPKPGAVVGSQALVVVYYQAIVVQAIPVVIFLVVLVADAGEGGVDASDRTVST